MLVVVCVTEDESPPSGVQIRVIPGGDRVLHMWEICCFSHRDALFSGALSSLIKVAKWTCYCSCFRMRATTVYTDMYAVPMVSIFLQCATLVSTTTWMRARSVHHHRQPPTVQGSHCCPTSSFYRVHWMSGLILYCVVISTKLEFCCEPVI